MEYIYELPAEMLCKDAPQGGDVHDMKAWQLHLYHAL